MLAVMARTRGKPQNFTPEQNEALRKALLAWKEKNDLNQEQLGEKLKVEQQSAGRLISARGPGFSYQTATRAARLLGFIGVDAFFETEGVALDARAVEPDPNTNPTQSDGMRAARAAGVSEKAIQLVNRRQDASVFHTAMWWTTQYISQQEALNEATRDESPATPKSSRPAKRAAS